MAAKPTFVTEEGLQKLKDELEHLKVVKRKEVAEALKQAKAFGDLSENSEYDEAKNEQAEVERHIAELEDILENIEIIKSTGKKNKIHVGSTVKVYDMEYDEEVTYTIVGSTESDPMDNKISDESPIGKALLGAKPDDEVQAETPGGLLKMKVLEIL
ncbi:MAG: transcription elongation factor GreA [Ruminococcaceae bacterium]|nr:transcription elongation factor GreA [Oscillospiraceae bacterium]